MSMRFSVLATCANVRISSMVVLASRLALLLKIFENNSVNHEGIRQVIEDICLRGADVIVLGCTHYHWIKELIVEIAGSRAQIVEPSEAIGLRVQELLQKKAKSPDATN